MYEQEAIDLKEMALSIYAETSLQVVIFNGW